MEIIHVNTENNTDYGLIDIHPKPDEGGGGSSDIPTRFTLEFWFKARFDPANTLYREILGMYTYNDDNATNAYYSGLEDGSEGAT